MKAALVLWLPCFAVSGEAATWTWTGASLASNNWSDPGNWNLIPPPPDNGTADLIFSGFLRPSPNVDLLWDIKSLTFAAVSAPFTLTASSIVFHGGGITNYSVQTQTFNNGGVVFTGANTINAAAGAIDINTMVIVDSTLDITGSFATNFDFGIDGYNTTLNKTGSGTLTLGGSGNTEEYHLAIAGGTVALSRTTTTTFDGPGSIAVNSGTLRLNSALTLDNTPLTCAVSGSVALAAGVTFAVTNGGDTTFSGNFEQYESGAIVNVSGSGSTLNSAGTISLSRSTLNVSAQAHVTAGSLDLSRAFGATVVVDGTGSNLLVNVATDVGGAESSSSLTFSNASSGQLGTLHVGGGWEFPIPTLLVQSSADISAGSITIAGSAGQFGTLTVTGSGSTSQQTGASTLTIGSSSGSALLSVANSAVFTSGTGLTSVNPSGTITINGGTYHANGNITLSGTMTRSASGVLNLAAGKTFTIASGGDFTLTGSFETNAAATINVTGAGSTLSSTSFLRLSNGATLNVSDGGLLSVGTFFDLGITGNANATFDGVNSRVVASGDSTWGLLGTTATVSFSNGATALLAGSLELGASDIDGTTGTLLVSSGSSVVLPTLALAVEVGATSGAITVTGTGSSVTQSGASALTMGSLTASTATIDVNNGGQFTSGTGTTTVSKTGVIMINGGTYSALGNMNIVGGRMTRNATGSFQLAAGKSLTLQSGGDVEFTGNYDLNTSATINVMSNSSFSTTGFMRILNSATLSATTGGDVLVGGYLDIGVTGNGTAYIDGTNSTLTAAGTCWWGDAGNTATVTFTNGASAAVSGSVDIARGTTAGTTGTLLVSGGAKATLPSVSVATGTGSTTGSITITGTGSALTQSGSSALTMGSTGSSTATLNVNSGATFTSGTGTATVNATGLVNINGGSYSALGNLVLNGGRLNRDGVGTFALAAGKTMTIQNSGIATFTGNYDLNSAATISLTGSGSILTTTGYMRVLNSGQLNISNGADVNIGTYFAVADLGNGSVVVDGVGSSLTAGVVAFGASHWGDEGAVGNITFRNSATGSFGATLEIARGTISGTSATVLIASNADVTLPSILLATGLGSTRGTFTVTGVGSTATQSGTSSLVIGAASASVGRLNVNDSGTFTSGTGSVYLNKTGTIALDATGVFVAQSNLTIQGALELTATSGLHLAAGKTITLSDQGALVFSGTTENVANWPVILGDGGGVVRVPNAGGALTMNGSIGGGTSLTKTGAGTLTVNGAQNYDELTVLGGTMNLKANLLGAEITNELGRLNVDARVTGSTVQANSSGGVYFSESQSLIALNIGPGGLVVLDSGAAVIAPPLVELEVESAARSVPEPSCGLLLAVVLPMLMGHRRL